MPHRSLMLALAAGALLCAATATAGPRIDDVKVLDQADRVVVEVSSSSALRHQSRVLRSLKSTPYAITLDVDGTLPPGVARRVRVMSGDVWSVRYGMYQSKPPRIRVSVAARRQVPHRLLYSADRSRITLEVGKTSAVALGSPGTVSVADDAARAPKSGALSAAAPTSSRALSSPRLSEPTIAVASAPPAPVKPAPARSESVKLAAARPAPADAVREAPPAAAPAPTLATAVHKPDAKEKPAGQSDAFVMRQGGDAAPVMWLKSQETASGPTADKGVPASTSAGPAAQEGGSDQLVRALPRDDAPPAPNAVRLDVEGAEISDVLALIIEQTKANIVFRPEEVQGTVTIRLRDATVEQALEAVTRSCQLALRKQQNTYFVGKPETLSAMFPAPSVRKLYTLKQATVTEITPIASKLFPAESGLSVLSQGPRLMVLSGPEEVVTQAVQILPELDVPQTESSPDDQDQQEEISLIYELKYLSQDSAAEMVQQAIPNTVAPSEGEGPKGGAEVTGVLRVVKVPGVTLPYGAAQSAQSMGGSTSMLGTQPAPVMSSSGVGGYGQGGALGMGGPSSAYKLLLIGPKRLVHQAVELLSSVDLPARQLRIEARVLDVSRTKTSDHGFAWEIGQDLTFREVIPDGVGGSPNPLKIGTFQRSTPFAIDVAIRAMVAEGRARVLAEPSIRVIDGTPGTIFIGDILRFVVSQQSTPTGNVVQIGETNVGIQLSVVGRASSDGYVTLNLNPNVSMATPGPDDLPQTRTRSVNTTVRVRDGETIVIGGLFSEQEMNDASKLPILGDLPVLGSLFRSRHKTKVNSEVVIFLKTQILPAEEGSGAEPAP